MTAEHFERTLQAYQKRRPFRSFLVRFISGESIDVDHPEAMVIRGGAAVYISAAGVPTLFDYESVSEVVGETERRSAWSCIAWDQAMGYFASAAVFTSQPEWERLQATVEDVA